VLPDYPTIKEEVSHRLDLFLRKRAIHHLGPGLSEVRRSSIHEGRTNAIIREDGERDETAMNEASAELEIKKSEIPSMTMEEMLKRFDSVAQRLAAQQAKRMFEAIDKGVTKVGNVIDNRGQEFSPETLFKAFETIQIDFDSEGRPKMPQFISGADLHQSAVKAGKEIEETPELKRRWDRIMARKREEWRAREASRELVG
jgi:hypothetical protein